MIIQITINDRLGALLDQRASEAGSTTEEFASGILTQYLRKEAKQIFQTKLNNMSLQEIEVVLGKVDEIRRQLLRGEG